MKGDKTKALHYYRRALSLDPSSVEVNCHFAFGAAKCGDLTEARAALERAERLPDAGVCPFDFAFAHVGLEEYDRAFEYLNRAFEIRDSDIVLLKSSIYMDPVRSDPRYLALLAKMGLA
jgi:tetratricopeptide (TPR) repeat protein